MGIPMRFDQHCGRIRTIPIVMCLVILAGLILGSSPEVYADTFGNTSISGMSAYLAPAGYVFFASFVAPSGGTLSAISFYAGSPSGNGNVGIYSDNSGKPGTLLVQGTPQALANGWNTFSASTSIGASTTYWLGFQMQNGNFYYATTAAGSMRNWITGISCCTMPSSVSSPMSGSGSYAVYATYSTGPPPNDFTITATTTSQTVGAGATADYSLSIQFGSSLSTTVNLGVTSGCPTGATCTFSPPSVTGSSTVTLSVPTLPTTPGGTTTITVTATSTSPALSHSVQVQLTVNPPGSYPVYVYAGASKVTVTVTWSGSGTAAIYLAGPGGSPTLSESGAVIYDRVVYVSGSSTPTYIHRVTFTLSSPPTSTQTWNALVALTGSYTVTIEVNSPSPTT